MFTGKGNNRKLSDEQIKELRFRYYAKREPMRRLAKDYDISRALVNNIVNYQNGYKDIEDLPELTKEIIENRVPDRVYNQKKNVNRRIWHGMD